jgi:O-antigen ligase/Tfp pilus assembly protein PilF
MDREKLDAWCERGIIGLVMAILVLGPLATGAVRGLEFLVIQTMTVCAVLLWVARLWLRPRVQLLMPPVGWVVLAFAAYAVASYFRADIEYIARLEVIRVLVYALLFFLLVNNLHRQEAVNLFAYTLVFLAMAISFYAAYQFFSGNARVWNLDNSFYQGRGTGTYINPNHLAGFLEMLLPLAMAFTIAGRMKPVLRILIGYSAFAILIGIGVTMSRGGWLASSITLLAFFLVLMFHRGYRIVALASLVTLIAAGAVVGPKSVKVQQRAQSVLHEANSKEYSRYLLWRPALELWSQSRLLGVGPGHFDYRFRSVRPQEIQLRPDRVHNDYLNTLVDWGIIGLALVLAGLVLAFLGVHKSWSFVGGTAPDLGSRRSNRFAFVLGGSFGLLAIGLHSLVDFNLQIPANAILAVGLLALVSSHLRFATERYWFNVHWPVKLVTTVLLLACVVALTYAGQRRASEYAAGLVAVKQSEYSNARINALKKAFAAEPQNFETAFQIGECYRVQSWEGGDDYAELATQAIKWFARASKLNPHDGYSVLWQALCLDWVGRYEESAPLISRAEELDPNGYYTVAHIGWHYVQAGQYAAARAYFERSIRLQSDNNPIAWNYLEICNRRLLEAATMDDLTRALRSQTSH